MCAVDKIEVVAAYAIQKPCFGVSGVPVRSEIWTFELHMQPLPHFINSTHFII
jgi:hypothetical protein